ncbi:MAG: DUF1566 domain-containing protein [Desulfobacteraceae bacterium]|nr:DUF1566 domain-containing protein [Desulfobacteraceae bacterium]
MDSKLIQDFLTGSSKEIVELREKAGLVTGFLKLAHQLNSLPQTERRFYEKDRSFFQATAIDRDQVELENILKDFFGSPIKHAGNPLPITLQLNPAVKYLRGAGKEQTLFLLQLNYGEFYGALWPWKKDSGKIEIHLGYCSEEISPEDYGKFALMVKKAISQKAFETIGTSVGGRIHGIGLPSFLQMSEMEGATFRLKINAGERQGFLHLAEGALISAEFGDLKGKDAAFKIISWDNPAIQIEDPVPNQVKDIQLPLMHILMESLKIKDESEYSPVEKKAAKEESGTAPSDSAPKMPGQKLASKPELPTERKAEPRVEPAAPEVPEVPPEMEIEPRVEAAAPEVAEAPPEMEIEPRVGSTAPGSRAKTIVDLDSIPGSAPDTITELDDLPVYDAESSESPASPPGATPAMGSSDWDDEDYPTELPPKKPFPKKIVLAITGSVVAILILIGGVVLLNKYKQKGFDRLIEQVESEQDADKKAAMLIAYLENNSTSKFVPQTNERLKQLQLLIEQNDYQLAQNQVAALVIDEKFKGKAADIFKQLITAHPDGQYAKIAEQNIATLDTYAEKRYFDKLSNSENLLFSDRLAANLKYMAMFPAGVNKPKVEQWIAGMGEEYYQYINKEAPACNQEERWNDCMELCDNFIQVFGRNRRITQVKKIRAELSDQRAYHDLSRRLAQANGDLEEIRMLYLDYLDRYPQTTYKKTIGTEIKRTEAKLNQRTEWMRLIAYVKNTRKPIDDRVRMLQGYVDKNYDGPYFTEADKMLSSLKIEYEEHLAESQQAALRKKEYEKKQREAMRAQQLAARVSQLYAMEKSKFPRNTDRYQVFDNGTFTDRRSRLTWTLLDSQQYTGGCLDYRNAALWVSQLTVGGYRDWRMPTTSELASLYKSAPYAPLANVQWYWSSEAYVKGFHKVVNIVTAEHSKVYERTSVTEQECGGVRAVRP